jgi:hypothetical protein
VFCDLPTIPAGPMGKLLLTQMAAVAELEAGLISQRTRAALQAARAWGRVLGGLRENQRPPTAEEQKRSAQAGAEAAKMAADHAVHRAAPCPDAARRGAIPGSRGCSLAAEGIPTPWEGACTATAVKRLLERATGEEVA